MHSLSTRTKGPNNAQAWPLMTTVGCKPQLFCDGAGTDAASLQTEG